MSREIPKLMALRTFENWVRDPNLDPRLGLAMAAGAVRVDEGELATLWMLKHIECDRAREAVASMDQGDAEAVRAHNAQYVGKYKPKRSKAEPD